MSETYATVRGERVEILGPKPDGWEGLGDAIGDTLVRYPDGEIGAVPAGDLRAREVSEP